jgi:hypothetical protein
MTSQKIKYSTNTYFVKELFENDLVSIKQEYFGNKNSVDVDGLKPQGFCCGPQVQTCSLLNLN